ncbi:hypothetical protein NGB36_03645 [Streptomyces sp. RB6PN25]|uniref:Secreted protein n=1 Tax=Streptomyces humicola TaxID=2953240 RepID=A0ABT1PPU9_9ACTN|nr:hypothetical protein [Streptomyces humicola]MCQ4079710.1 hypothetical protein [Streptomyces humicola]
MLNAKMKVGYIAATAALTAAGILAGAGNAAADTITCSDTLPAHTNGNIANDVPQQTNKDLGQVADLLACTVKQANNGLNGADNDQVRQNPLATLTTR